MFSNFIRTFMQWNDVTRYPFLFVFFWHHPVASALGFLQLIAIIYIIYLLIWTTKRFLLCPNLYFTTNALLKKKKVRKKLTLPGQYSGRVGTALALQHVELWFNSWVPGGDWWSFSIVYTSHSLSECLLVFSRYSGFLLQSRKHGDQGLG